MNQMEVRCSSSIPLEMASLFFREKKIDSGPAQSLNDLGIFQLPHRAAWFRDYFILKQQWYYKEDGDYVEFYDTGHEVFISSGEVIAKLQAIKS